MPITRGILSLAEDLWPLGDGDVRYLFFSLKARVITPKTAKSKGSNVLAAHAPNLQKSA